MTGSRDREPRYLAVPLDLNPILRNFKDRPTFPNTTHPEPGGLPAAGSEDHFRTSRIHRREQDARDFDRWNGIARCGARARIRIDHDTRTERTGRERARSKRAEQRVIHLEAREEISLFCGGTRGIGDHRHGVVRLLSENPSHRGRSPPDRKAEHRDKERCARRDAATHDSVRLNSRRALISRPLSSGTFVILNSRT